MGYLNPILAPKAIADRGKSKGKWNEWWETERRPAPVSLWLLPSGSDQIGERQRPLPASRR